MKASQRHAGKLAALLMVVGAALACAASAQEGKSAEPPRGTQPGLADELRGDMGAQKRSSDIERQIERVRQIADEVSENAQNLRLAHARVKDALENNDCNVAAAMLQTLKRSRQSLERLGASLEAQCKDVHPQAQKRLAEACGAERQTLQTEGAALQRQHDEVLGMCPALRGK